MKNSLRSKRSFPIMHDEKKDKITGDKEKANGFLNEFKKPFSKDNGSLLNFPFLNSKRNTHGINFSQQNAKKHLKQIKKSSASRPNGLPELF